MSVALELRPEVAAFAQIMERKLRENAAKGGWKNCDTTYLSRRCGNELNELRAAVSDYNRVRAHWPYDKKRIAELAIVVALEAADVANFSMMMADVTMGLTSSAPGEAGEASVEGKAQTLNSRPSHG